MSAAERASSAEQANGPVLYALISYHFNPLWRGAREGNNAEENWNLMNNDSNKVRKAFSINFVSTYYDSDGPTEQSNMNGQATKNKTRHATKEFPSSSTIDLSRK